MSVSRKVKTTGELIDYKNIRLLQSSITESGSIQQRKNNGLSAKEQRCLSKQIKKARFLALLPYTSR